MIIYASRSNELFMSFDNEWSHLSDEMKYEIASMYEHHHLYIDYMKNRGEVYFLVHQVA